jgi:hypothetical protein
MDSRLLIVKVNAMCRDIPLCSGADLSGVSAEGGFLSTDRPMPVGTMLVLAPTLDDTVQVPSRVTRVVEARKTAPEAGPAGMGLAFEAMGEGLLRFASERSGDAPPPAPETVAVPLEPPPFRPRGSTLPGHAAAPALVAALAPVQVPEPPAPDPVPLAAASPAPAAKLELEIADEPQAPAPDVPVIVLTPRPAAAETPLAPVAEPEPAPPAAEAAAALEAAGEGEGEGADAEGEGDGEGEEDEEGKKKKRSRSSRRKKKTRTK